MSTTTFPNMLKKTRTELEAESVNFAYEADRIKAAERAADDELNLDIAEDLARELPAQTAILGGRAALEKAIANDRGEEARILAIIAQHAAKHRQIKASRRAKEDMRDSLLASEA